MRKDNFIVLILVLFLLQFFSLYGQVNQEVSINEYVIGPMDLLEITVFELPELNQTVRVSEDGSITIPLLGRVMIGGSTKDEIEKKISNLLDEKYIKNAKVSIFIKEYQSKLVSIIGAVKNPGPYEIIGRQTLLQMISKAGGFTERAADELFILREGDNGLTASISIDLKELLLNGNQKQNIPLQANDIINVTVDKTIQIFVFGMVKSPGELTFKISQKVTLLQAIAKAGGTTEGAKKGAIMIKRIDEDGEEIKIKVNLREIIKDRKPDITLRDGDVIIVPESIW